MVSHTACTYFLDLHLLTIARSVDMSEEAVKARAQALPDDLKNSLALDDEAQDGEAQEDSVYDQLGKWIDDAAKEKGDINKVPDVEIYLKAKELGIEGKHRTPAVLAQTIFSTGIVKEIEPRASMLKKLITSEKHEKAFLGGIERFVGNDHPELVAQVSSILLQVYENDLVSEETLKAWGAKASKKYVDLATSRKVRKSAEKFIEWLDNAESDEESEEESD
jgi:translation initiation factor 5